jgi:hypothetical protein
LETVTIRKLLDTAKDYHKTMLLLAWTSRLRREEIWGLCWSAFRTIPLPVETFQELNKKEKRCSSCSVSSFTWWGMLVSNQRPLECELPNNEKMNDDFSVMAATFAI